jgi:beta-galactosidase/beta-glucuronidase
MSARALLERTFPSTASSVSESIPRPEYPQPQFQREEWLNLNGTWQFEFDDQNVGVEEGWQLGDQRLGRNILVPFCFESPKSGIGDPGQHPVVWYQREFQVPGPWHGRRLLLNFGAVDYRATVWLNGKLAGQH